MAVSALVLRRHSYKYDIVVFLVCGVVFFLLLNVFLSISVFNSEIEVRPASGFSPVVSLFFGLPAILSCSLANTIADALNGISGWTLLYYFLAQVLYNGLPYLLWYLIEKQRGAADPYPSLTSSSKLLLYLALMTLDAVLLALVLYPATADLSAVYNMPLIYGLNDFIFLIYLGMPLLIVLDLIPIEPIAPRFMQTRYRQRSYTPLTQRMVLAFTLAALFLAVVYLFGSYVPSIISSDTEFALLIAHMYTFLTILTIIVFSILVILLHFVESRLTRPIEKVTQASKDFMGQVHAHEEKPEAPIDVNVDTDGVVLRHEMRDLVTTTDETHRNLVDYMDRLTEATAQQQREEAELDIARTIQMGALPTDFTSLTERFHLDIAAFMRAAKAVGGDFYDVFEVGDHSVGFVIADVSGKGVPAALFMMRAQSIIRECVMAYPDLGTAFTFANRKLCEHNDNLTFVTAFACVLDVTTGDVDFVNAGHNAPLIAGHGDHGYIQSKPGLMLGVMDTIVYTSHTLSLAPTEGIFLFTDGVTEACDTDLELFGESRLLFTASSEHEGAADLNRKVLEAVDRFAGDEPQADDITMLCFSWNLPAYTLALPPEAERLDELFDWLEPLCLRDGCTPKMHHDLMLVCEELFVNVVHYGFPEGQPVQPVSIQVAVDDARELFHLAISDAGIPYNPLEYHSEKVVPGVEHRIGGLGILLVRDAVDEIRYERSNGLNVLHMTKRFE